MGRGSGLAGSGDRFTARYNLPLASPSPVNTTMPISTPRNWRSSFGAGGLGSKCMLYGARELAVLTSSSMSMAAQTGHWALIVKGRSSISCICAESKGQIRSIERCAAPCLGPDNGARGSAPARPKTVGLVRGRIATSQGMT